MGFITTTDLYPSDPYKKMVILVKSYQLLNKLVLMDVTELALGCIQSQKR